MFSSDPVSGHAMTVTWPSFDSNTSGSPVRSKSFSLRVNVEGCGAFGESSSLGLDVELAVEVGDVSVVGFGLEYATCDTGPLAAFRGFSSGQDSGVGNFVAFTTSRPCGKASGIMHGAFWKNLSTGSCGFCLPGIVEGRV